jgi:hypothetical protein
LRLKKSTITIIKSELEKGIHDLYELIAEVRDFVLPKIGYLDSIVVHPTPRESIEIDYKEIISEYFHTIEDLFHKALEIFRKDTDQIEHKDFVILETILAEVDSLDNTLWWAKYHLEDSYPSILNFFERIVKQCIEDFKKIQTDAKQLLDIIESGNKELPKLVPLVSLKEVEAPPLKF